MIASVVVGNPKLRSRTRSAAEALIRTLTGGDPDHVIEVAELGPGLLGWGDGGIAAAVQLVSESDLVVIASPTFKGTYTGLLKTFLDKFAGGTGMEGVVAVPLMLGGSWNHALAPELSLKPVLVELGATTPLPGLYLLDSSYETDGVLDTYSERWRTTVQRVIHADG